MVDCRNVETYTKYVCRTTTATTKRWLTPAMKCFNKNNWYDDNNNDNKWNIILTHLFDYVIVNVFTFHERSINVKIYIFVPRFKNMPESIDFLFNLLNSTIIFLTWLSITFVRLVSVSNFVVPSISSILAIFCTNFTKV